MCCSSPCSESSGAVGRNSSNPAGPCLRPLPHPRPMHPAVAAKQQQINKYTELLYKQQHSPTPARRGYEQLLVLMMLPYDNTHIRQGWLRGVRCCWGWREPGRIPGIWGSTGDTFQVS